MHYTLAFLLLLFGAPELCMYMYVVVSSIIPHAIKDSDVVNINTVLTSDVAVAIKSNLMLLERLSFSC